MEKIKLAIAAQANGGVSEYLKDFIRYINKDKYKIILLLSFDYKNEIDDFIELGCEIRFIDMVREINFVKDILAILKINKMIKLINPDLIYAHSSKAGVLVRLAISKKKIPIIYNAHGWAFNMRVNKIKKAIYCLVEKVCSYNTSRIVCISDFEKEGLCPNEFFS